MKKLAITFCFIMCFSSCVINQDRALFALPSVNECTFSLDPLTKSIIKWEDNRFPISFYVHKSVSTEAYYNFVTALEYWNSVWYQYLADKGMEASPLFDIIGENQLFAVSPKRDGYNVLFFTDVFGKYASVNQNVKMTQAVTIIRRIKSEIKDTDIIVNNHDFKFFYDKNYNRNDFLSSTNRSSFRGLSNSRSLTLMESIKVKLHSFFQSFLRLLKQEVFPKRDIAERKAIVPKGYIDFPSLMIHELGHVPGLYHSDDEIFNVSGAAASTSARTARSRARSVMKSRLPERSSRRIISTFDLDNLFCGYYGQSK